MMLSTVQVDVIMCNKSCETGIDKRSIVIDEGVKGNIVLASLGEFGKVFLKPQENVFGSTSLFAICE